MKFKKLHKDQYIMGLELLNLTNKSGCTVCNQKFNLGDSVVLACGGWADDCAKLIHENEAVYDVRTDSFIEKQYYYATR